ncbi:MAG: histidine phosphatase family protein [Thermoanaerobaculia bacterium]|nr:histidine phosphatase family protein [Thermoanaerobaculia bacterium]
MRLLAVRHAIAEDRALWAARGLDEAARPLTAAGRARFRKAARGLAAEVGQLDLVATSPLARAVQTAEILAAAAGAKRTIELPELAAGDDLPALLAWIAAQRKLAAVALVGHEPSLSLLCGWLLTGEERPLFALKKGGACLLEFGARVALRGAELRFLLAAGQLRRLARP